MMQWTIRELLLIVGILAFIAAYVVDSRRQSSLPQDEFHLPDDCFIAWAQEIDGNCIDGSSTHGGQGRRDWPTTDSSWFEFITTAARADEVARNIRRQAEARIAADGWRLIRRTSHEKVDLSTLKRGESIYVLQSQYFTKPLRLNPPNDRDHVSLILKWIGVGFTETYGEMQLARPASAE